MKNLTFIFALLLMPISCGLQKKGADKEKAVIALKPEKDEEGEWDIDVLDPQYNYFLTAIAHPMSFYTESSLKARNRILVTEWNSLFMTGQYRNVIESRIDYDPQENYGLKFEYKLYQVFAYLQWKYRIRLNGLSAVDMR